jgi:hypothetical protein
MAAQSFGATVGTVGFGSSKRHRQAAAVAHPIAAGLEVVGDGDAIVEDKAVAFPFAFCFGDGFQIVQDAALEVVDLREAFGQHPGAGFFAANAAGTKHGHFAVLLGIEVAADVVGKLGERGGVGVDRPFKSPNFHFVFVAGINQQNFRVGNQIVPIFWGNVGADLLVGIGGGFSEGDNLGFDFDFEFGEGFFAGAGGSLIGEVGQAGVLAQVVEGGGDGWGWGGDRSIDPFGGQQNSALDFVSLTIGLKLLLKFGAVIEGDKFVKGGDGQHGWGWSAIRQYPSCGIGRILSHNWGKQRSDYTDELDGTVESALLDV